MGCAWGKSGKQKLGNKNFALLASQTCFTEVEVEALYKLYKKLSSSLVDDGLISKDKLLLGLFKSKKKQSLFADRIFKLFDYKHDGVIDLQEFVHSLSVFHPAAPEEEKAIFAFKMYDTGDTGFIERNEVEELIWALLDESSLVFSSEIIEAIIDKTFEDADSKNDGKIDLEEWKQFVTRNPLVLKNMTILHLKDIRTAFPSFIVKPETEDDPDSS